MHFSMMPYFASAASSRTVSEIALTVVVLKIHHPLVVVWVPYAVTRVTTSLDICST